jgi:hypothetical protein
VRVEKLLKRDLVTPLQVSPLMGRVLGQPVLLSKNMGRVLGRPIQAVKNMNKDLNQPIPVEVWLKVDFLVTTGVFVMEDGTTPFVDEAGVNQFKPE